MKNKNLPASLVYYKTLIFNKNFDDAHKYLLKQIGLLMGLGWKYEDVKNLSILKAARDYLVRKFEKDNYPYLFRLVDYIYTRDRAYHLFGAWVKISPIDILACNEYANYLIKTKYIATSQIKLAGFLFSLQIFNQVSNNILNASRENVRLRMERSSPEAALNLRSLLNFFDENIECEFIRVSNPDDIYNIAGVEYKTFHKYCDLLNIKTCYERSSYRGQIKTTLWIIKPTYLISQIERLKEINIERYADIIKDIRLEDLTYLMSTTNVREFNTLKNNFEIRYANTNKKYFANRPLPGFPFYRMDIFSESKDIYIPLKLINYHLIIASLFGNKRNVLIEKELSLLPSTLKNIKTPLKILKERLLDANLYSKYYPVSTPLDINETGRHFEQILKVSRSINQLNMNGIEVDTKKMNLLIAKLEERRQLKSNIIDMELIGTWLKELERIKNNLTNGDQGTRLTGHFTIHASDTHRMTCSRYPLQKISKEIKSEIFCAPKGWALLSADISGQDIVVSSNLAKRIYNDPLFNNEEDTDEIVQLKEMIDGTLNKLKLIGNDIARPIDYITNKIILEEDKLLSGLSRNEIRSNLKSIIYSTFYGGSANTLVRNMKKELDETIWDLEIDANTIVRSGYRVPKKLNIETTKSRIKKLEKLLYEINTDVWFNPDSDDYEDEEKEDLQADYDELIISFGDTHSLEHIEFQPMINPILSQKMEDKINPKLNFGLNYSVKSNSKIDLTNRIIYKPIENSEVKIIYNSILDLLSERVLVKKKVEQIKILSEKFLKYMKNEYPGVLESFKYYEKYLVVKNKNTYPTLLGWQTVLDDKSQHSIKFSKTRSKSYVIQASGAEFIRQWLIELSKVNGYQNTFKIVNVIHDQIMVEVKEDWVDFVKESLIKTAKEAARIVGIDPKTIHIPEVEVFK